MNQKAIELNIVAVFLDILLYRKNPLQFGTILLCNKTHITKGQLISIANCQAKDSSKKRTNEFIFTRVPKIYQGP